MLRFVNHGPNAGCPRGGHGVNPPASTFHLQWRGIFKSAVSSQLEPQPQQHAFGDVAREPGCRGDIGLCRGALKVKPV